MKNIILIIGLLIPLSVLSQSEVELSFTTIKGYSNPQTAPFHYLLADNVALRQSSFSTSKVLSRMRIGTKFKILQKSSNSMVLNGIKSNWYQIEVGDKMGWVWGGMISQLSFGSEADPEIKFVSGYEKVVHSSKPHENGIFYQIRAFKKNVQLDKLVFKSSARGLHTYHPPSLGSKGLKNVDDIIVVNGSNCESCGCDQIEVYIFWNKHKFHHTTNLHGIADGAYGSSENFIFPTDMEGVPGYVIKRTDHELEESKDEKKVHRVTEDIFFLWNGIHLYKSERRSIIKKYTHTVDED